jgi:ethanolamine ammonia-lyase small subunit
MDDALQLRNFTSARVALARAGNSLSTAEVLAFQAAHAAARDAVHWRMDAQALALECKARGWPSVTLQSAAPDRATYLRRPDLGRKLKLGQELGVPHAAGKDTEGEYDLAIILADGLSALAIHRHALELWARLLPLLDPDNWHCSPLILVEQGRVAIGDEIGEKLHAALSLVLIGERPGLSAADSLGAYLTWNPVTGRTDAERNCISNIRPAGLHYDQAAQRIFVLLTQARSRQLTGVLLKESLALPK